MGKFFSVRNFDQFQHYKDRSPPWIKLYHDILDNYEFACLQDASKLHLIMIWLLATRNNNKLPCNPVWLASRINATGKVDLEPLFAAGFIEIIEVNQSLPLKEQGASKVPAGRKQSATGHARLEEERREEKIYVENVFSHWVTRMSKPKAKLTKERIKKIKDRKSEGYTEEDLKLAINGCASSEFHMGKNDRNTPYNDLELICRSGGNVENFRDSITAAKQVDLRACV